MTVPSAGAWTVVFNTTQETDADKMFGSLTESARGSARSERIDTHVEKFLIRSEPAALVLEWEKTRVRMPIKAN